jgi:hypothetical protein
MPSEHQTTLKHKAVDELRTLWVIFLYLAFMLSALVSYRRLVLHEVGVSYLHYGFAFLEAAIVAKVILLGRALGLGRRAERDYPLIFTVLCKAILYAALLGLFTVLEHLVEGLLHHQGWHAVAQRLASVGRDEFLARTLMVLVAFVPLFAVSEAARVLGEDDLYALFFVSRARRGPGGGPARSA